uniref:myc target protein 1 homolog n=1 Tax=Doryrhamphus excisus TaxID=161450 RepID=UPI0025AE48C9|nr:myc target protein 1 homolog [Doryrhamphus excisus]
MYLLILKPEREGSTTAKFPSLGPPPATPPRKKPKQLVLGKAGNKQDVEKMAHNDTHPLLEILQSFDTGDMILAFCLSILVGLLLGALVYVLLTWASRRRATARITRRTKKTRKKPSASRIPTDGQLGLYRSTFLNVYRQPSLEPVGPLGSKPGPETSTFRPAPRKGSSGTATGDDAQVQIPEDTVASDSESLVPNKRHSFWLGGNGLKGFLPSQTPPPAYNSIIHAFQESCT